VTQRGSSSGGLLVRNPVFRRFWLGRALSNTGDGAAALALLVYVQEGTSSGSAVSALLLAQTVPRFALGPIAGAIADRFEQRRVMIVSDIAQALLFAVVAFALPPFSVVLLLLVTGATVAATVFGPAGAASLPELVDADDLPPANAWLGTAFNLQLVFGPLLGGVLVAMVGIQGALTANVVSFVLSAILISRLPVLPPTEGAGDNSLLKQTIEGLRYTSSHKVARLVVLSLTFTVAFAALDDVALVFLAREVLHVGAAGFGVMASAYGIGMFTVALALTRFSQRFKSRSIYLGGMLMTGVGGLATGVAPALAIGASGQALAGVGNGAQNVATETLIQQTIPKGQLGRVFGTVTSGAFLGGTLARGFGGPLIEATSPRALFLIGGSGVILTTLLTTLAFAQLDPASADNEEA
jgi:MFS family permease